LKRLRPQKLHVSFANDANAEGPIHPRCYTMTHSDRTGDLYLTIGPAHDLEQIAGWYTRFMRDEMLAEWRTGQDGPALHVHCHVCGGLAFGTARLRDRIFRRVLPLVLEALRYGDRALYDAHPELDQAPIRVHFHARLARWRTRYDRVESWGIPADYC
jgi:hypothetical protein